MIQDGFVDISNNNFAYVVQTWQKDGRYEFITTTQEQIDKAELVYAGFYENQGGTALDEYINTSIATKAIKMKV